MLKRSFPVLICHPCILQDEASDPVLCRFLTGLLAPLLFVPPTDCCTALIFFNIYIFKFRVRPYRSKSCLCLFKERLACGISRLTVIFFSTVSLKILCQIVQSFKLYFLTAGNQYLHHIWYWFAAVQFSCSVVSDSLWPHGLQHARLPCPSPAPRVVQTHVRWVGDVIQPSHPLSSPSPAFNLSQHQGLSNESVLHIRWPKYWSFSFSSSLSSEHSGLISFRIDWFDLLAVPGTLKSLQHHNLKTTILQHSAFFMFQLSHLCMTTGKTIALTTQTFVSKVRSLLFSMLSRIVIVLLPRSKRLLISWRQSPSAVILEPRKNNVWHCFHCFSIYFPWSDGTGCHDLRFLNVEL